MAWRALFVEQRKSHVKSSKIAQSSRGHDDDGEQSTPNDTGTSLLTKFQHHSLVSIVESLPVWV